MLASHFDLRLLKTLQDKFFPELFVVLVVPQISSTNSQQILLYYFTTWYRLEENQPEKTYSIKISWEENSRYYCQCHSCVTAAAASHYAFVFFSYHNVAVVPWKLSTLS